MIFSHEQLKDHDDIVRCELRNKIIGFIDNYAENCRLQALAQGITASTDVLRGSMEACQFLASVLATQNK